MFRLFLFSCSVAMVFMRAIPTRRGERMDRRELLKYVGFSQIAWALPLTSTAYAAPPVPSPEESEPLPPTALTAAYHACEVLAGVCSLTESYCLDALRSSPGNAKSLVELHRCLVDCREVCSLAVSMYMRQSPRQAIFCIACAEVCERCADVAEKIQFQHKEFVLSKMRECADLGRKTSNLAIRPASPPVVK